MRFIIIPLFFITFTLGLSNNNPNLAFGGFFLGTSIAILFTTYFKSKIIIDRGVLYFFILMILYPIFFSVYYEVVYQNLNFRYLYLLFQLVVIFLLFHAGLQLHIYKNSIGYYVSLVIFTLVFLSIFLGNSSIVGKENIYASILLILLSYTLCLKVNNKLKIFNIVLVSYGIFFSDARSSLLALALVILSYVFYPLLSNFRKIIFFSIFFLSLFWIFFIVYLYNTGKGDIYNLLVYELTGKQLYSGREKMWGDFIDAINESPILGYGLGVDYTAIAEIEYSTHNLYLAILLQQGILGIIIFISLLYLIYKKSNNILSANEKSFSFLIIPAVLLQQNFELSLTQNNLSIMLIFWFLLGVSYYPNNSE